jgi:hypothetical protein
MLLLRVIGENEQFQESIGLNNELVSNELEQAKEDTNENTRIDETMNNSNTQIDII